MTPYNKERMLFEHPLGRNSTNFAKETSILWAEFSAGEFAKENEHPLGRNSTNFAKENEQPLEREHP